MAQPNIVLIITDQQRYDTIGALGFDHMTTPHMDRLVTEGVAFERCYCTAPSCVPSRASLFSGYYPHTTGVYCNGDKWQRSWVEALADSGYYCVNVGKMHTNPIDAPAGFHRRYIVENKDRPLGKYYYEDDWQRALRVRGFERPSREKYALRPDHFERLGAYEWELPPDLHPDNFVGATAAWWIENYRGEKPFFLEVGFPGPHPPYDPTPDWAECYLEREIPLPVVTEEEMASEPPPLQALRQEHMRGNHDAVVHRPRPKREHWRRQWAYYLANVSMIDENVGAILAALERRGFDDTVVIFTSDHGDSLGQHGHSQKWTMYEESTRVPLIVWAPGRYRGGVRVEPLVQLMDVGPTVLEIAGLEPPDTMEARSLVDALEGSPFAGRNVVFAEHGRDNHLREISLMTMVRTVDFKLVHFAGERFGQLFDLMNDPDERHNLWDDPGYDGVKRELLDTMREWLVESNYRTRSRQAPWR